MNERRWTLEEPKTRRYVPLEHHSEFTGRQFDSSTMALYGEFLLDTHQAEKGYCLFKCPLCCPLSPLLLLFPSLFLKSVEKKPWTLRSRH